MNENIRPREEELHLRQKLQEQWLIRVAPLMKQAVQIWETQSRMRGVVKNGGMSFESVLEGAAREQYDQLHELIDQTLSTMLKDQEDRW